ncbi:MAG: SGNH/GDSL hydrolase family protein, partial [Ruminococcus sp.]
FSDSTEYTFYGALHVLYRKLIEKYPDSDIIVITPLHRLIENDGVNELGLPCQPLKKYVEAIREVAEYYSLPVLDLYKNGGMQPSVNIIRKKYMPDGLHPSDAGATKIAQRPYNFLLTL